MAQKIKLSVAIITLNEENNIARCIESVISIADEIIIVDSFSTDNTERIASQFPLRFIKNKFEGHIEQKNFALKATSYQWVLSLDADESLSAEAIKAISEIKNNTDADAYSFNRLTNYCGKWIYHSGWYPDIKVRMVNKEKAVWQGINPHDQLVLDQGGKIKHIKANILHYSINSIKQHLETIEKFSTIAAKARFDKGQNARFLKIYLHTIWKYLKIYFVKTGFLDGKYGFLIARFSAYSTFLRYSKLRKLNKNRKTDL